MNEQLPEKMTGADLVAQENYEFSIERDYVNKLDRVDRRDKRGEIISSAVTEKYRRGYDSINWNK